MIEREYIRLDITGNDATLFKKLFSKLTKTIEEVVESLSNNEISEPTKETISELTQITQQYIQAKIQKPSLENEKLLAEITKEYAQIQESLASARKTRAEAEAIETENVVKKLKAIIETTSLLTKMKLIEDKEHNHFIIDLSTDNI